MRRNDFTIHPISERLECFDGGVVFLVCKSLSKLPLGLLLSAILVERRGEIPFVGYQWINERVLMKFLPIRCSEGLVVSIAFIELNMSKLLF